MRSCCVLTIVNNLYVKCKIILCTNRYINFEIFQYDKKLEKLKKINHVLF